MNHRVLTYKMEMYPFRKMWRCYCGHIFNARYMGPALVKEFRAHVKEEENARKKKGEAVRLPADFADRLREAGGTQSAFVLRP